MTTGTIRTVSDGIRFKNQKLNRRHFLFWRWDECSDLGHYNLGFWVVSYFDTIGEAKVESKKSEEYYEKLHEWEEV